MGLHERAAHQAAVGVQLGKAVLVEMVADAGDHARGDRDVHQFLAVFDPAPPQHQVGWRGPPPGRGCGAHALLPPPCAWPVLPSPPCAWPVLPSPPCAWPVLPPPPRRAQITSARMHEVWCPGATSRITMVAERQPSSA